MKKIFSFQYHLYKMALNFFLPRLRAKILRIKIHAHIVDNMIPSLLILAVKNIEVGPSAPPIIATDTASFPNPKNTLATQNIINGERTKIIPRISIIIAIFLIIIPSKR